MKTNSVLWMSLACCLVVAGLNTDAADEPATSSSASKTVIPSSDSKNKVGDRTTSTNAVEVQAVRMAQTSVSVRKTKIADAKPQSSRHKKYGGPVYAVFKSKDAYQLINPFAPKRYGNAEDNMPKDPSTGKPAGVTLFAAHIWGGE